MAFVNEKGGLQRAVDSEKYAALYNKETGKQISFLNQQWTIDRDRKMLLVCTYEERQDMYEGDFFLSSWLFYWRNIWVSLSLKDYDFRRLSKDHYELTRKIIKIDFPQAPSSNQEVMFNDLRQAFQAYKVIGARAEREYRCDLTLDYSEVI